MGVEKETANLQIVDKFGEVKEKILSEIKKVIIGQDSVIEELLVTMFCRAHCLVVGVPGLAKTLMVKTVSQIFDLEFKRIQFTPDLMPSDIIGTDVLEDERGTGKRNFKFIKGPIFGNILLADEINRTPPKTQSALLEAMQEYRVTAGGATYELPSPFFVLATQNPIEQEGTYPLPEAQLDRFMFNILIDYPEEAEEREIVAVTTKQESCEPSTVLNAEDILSLQLIVRQIPVSDHVINYATNLVRSTRPQNNESPQFIKDYVTWGCGPRAGQYLILGAKARAIVRGRVNVSTDDVRAVCLPVMRHRIFTNFQADAEGINVDDIVSRLLETIKEPDESDYK